MNPYAEACLKVEAPVVAHFRKSFQFPNYPGINVGQFPLWRYGLPVE